MVECNPANRGHLKLEFVFLIKKSIHFSINDWIFFMDFLCLICLEMNVYQLFKVCISFGCTKWETNKQKYIRSHFNFLYNSLCQKILKLSLPVLWKRFEIKSHQRRACYLKPRRNGGPIPTGGGSRSPPPHWLGLNCDLWKWSSEKILAQKESSKQASWA